MTTLYKSSLLMRFCLSLFTASICNTFRGLGQDMEEAGDVIDETAEDMEEDLED